MTRPWIVAIAAATSLWFSAAAGCDFFHELQDAESAATSDTAGTDSAGTDSGGTDPAGDTVGTDTDGLCDVLTEDACLSQDSLKSCDPANGHSTVYSCSALCGAAGSTAIACTLTPSALHACLCGNPGAIKKKSCTEVEACALGCGGDSFDACVDTCFANTDTTTARLFGSLLTCAYMTCNDTCLLDPSLCQACLGNALNGAIGDCVQQRTLCDQDTVDGSPWLP